MVQAGNRCTGGNRVFFIPPSLLKGSYEDFLDKYNEMVPGCFGVDKEYPQNVGWIKGVFGGIKNFFSKIFVISKKLPILATAKMYRKIDAFCLI